MTWLGFNWITGENNNRLELGGTIILESTVACYEYMLSTCTILARLLVQYTVNLT